MTNALLAWSPPGWYCYLMQSDSNGSDTAPPDTEASDATPAATKRSEAYRERFRHSQMVAAQVARARAAGGRPSESEAARLIGEFHARGGQVTVCPEPDDAAPDTNDRGNFPRRART